MTLSKYFFVMFLATFFAWSGFFYIIYFINPYEADVGDFLLFYTCLGLGLTGIISILSAFIRVYILKSEEMAFRLVSKSFRQGALFAVLLVLAIFLKEKSLLTWWNLLILIFLVTMIELFFISFKRKAV